MKNEPDHKYIDALASTPVRFACVFYDEKHPAEKYAHTFLSDSGARAMRGTRPGEIVPCVILAKTDFDILIVAARTEVLSRIERCEGGCAAPVVAHDCDGVPLCQACSDALKREE